LCVTIAAIVLLIPLAIALINPDWLAAENAPSAPFVRDALSRVIQPATLFAGLGLLVLIAQRPSARYPAEHFACLLFIIAGTSLVASANDLVALFVSLELISIPTYVLLFLSRPDARALESTTKYFLLSIFSSAFLLYGLSLLLGSAGATNLAAIDASLRQPTGVVNIAMLQIALVLVVAGLGFRIAAVPFHFYAPDVFQGTTLPSAALLAIIPKIAGFVALLRLAWSLLLTAQPEGAPFVGLDRYGMAVIAVLAFLSMTVGNVLALLQSDLRRLLAYSSVAHAGYMLIGVAVPSGMPDANGGQAVLFYLLVYTIMTLGAFGVIVMLQRPRPAVTIDDLVGLGATNPLAALLLAVFLFGLTGLPPTVGFWGKFNLFMAAWASDIFYMKLLAVGLAINAAIAAWYYLRVIKTAYLDSQRDPTPAATGASPWLFGAMGICAASTIALFFFPQALLGLLQGVN
jgi:NADH-quinone oxidoreductase subunit N